MHLILSSVDFIFPKMLTIIICLIIKCLFNLVSDHLLYSFMTLMHDPGVILLGEITGRF